MAINVYLYGDESACKSVLYPIFSGEHDYKVVGACSRETDVLHGVSSSGTDILMVYVDGSDAVLRAVQQIYVLRPGIIIVGIVSQSVLETSKLLSAQIQYAYDERMSKKQILDQLRVLFTVERNRIEALSGSMVVADTKYVAFISAKDGVGKTTALANMAIALAKCNKKVIVVDCDMTYGDVGCYFGIDASHNDMGELLQEIGEPTIDDIRKHVIIHESGVNVLCGPRGPEIAEKISATQIARVLAALRSYYDYVLIDSSTTINDIFFTIIENAADLYVCVRPDIAVLKHSKTLLSLMYSLGVASKAHLLVSFASPDVQITSADVTRVLKTELALEIPYDWENCCAAANNGIPLVLGEPKNHIARAFTEYAQQLTGVSRQARSKGWFGRKKKKVATQMAVEATPGKKADKLPRRGLFGRKKNKS